MMRPAHQKVTDPQQKMMNTMMNFMPLTVILFGANFASGAVLYWVAQAIYSVVQQWFITGWGAMAEWFPWLPEMPEHRRLGYVAPKTAEELAVQSGQPVKKGRFAEFMEKQTEAARQKQEEAQRKRDEVTAAQKEARSTSAQGPAKSTKRSDYQSRVDAATRYRKENSGTATAETAPAVQQRPRPKRKKKA
jgi:YidC/Oxa1 family membrane protein insertase